MKKLISIIFAFVCISLLFIPGKTAAVEDISLLCTPEITNPCIVCRRDNGCPCLPQHKAENITVNDGTKVCVPRGLSDEVIKHCLAVTFPEKMAGLGFGPDVMATLGMEGPYGLIFFKRLGLIKQVTEKYIINGRIIEQTGGYTEYTNTVKTTFLGKTDRETLKKPWNPM
tara:strand:- start:1339 stop:1848 length:510 start_codon:yes stop_codon:yes gene_type:complete